MTSDSRCAFSPAAELLYVIANSYKTDLADLLPMRDHESQITKALTTFVELGGHYQSSCLRSIPRIVYKKIKQPMHDTDLSGLTPWKQKGNPQSLVKMSECRLQAHSC